jgi:ABC-type sulfate transport system permease subunit
MVEKTILALPGKKVSVPRVFKRTVQVALAAVLTAAVMLVVMVGNGLFTARGASLQGGLNTWLAFVKRPDIYATILLTAVVTVLMVYWQRDKERG